MNGATFYHELMGEGEPLVLAHAGIADGRMWDRQFEALAGRYCVVRPEKFNRIVLEFPNGVGA